MHSTLLKAKLPVVHFLLQRAHRDNLHKWTLYVRKTGILDYWVEKGFRKFKSSCAKCWHRNVYHIHPPIEDLSRERLAEHLLPLSHTRVDYFGQIEVKFTTSTEEMVLYFHLSSHHGSTQTSTFIRDRAMSSGSIGIHCKIWLPKYRLH